MTTRAETIAIAAAAGIDIYDGAQPRMLYDGDLIDALGRLIDAARQEPRRKILLDLWNALPGHEATGDTAGSLRATLMLSDVGDEIKERIKAQEIKL